VKQQILPYTIRPMDPADIPAVVAIDRLSFPTPWPASSYAYELNHSKQSFYYTLLKPATTSVAPSGPRWHRWWRGLFDQPEEKRVIGYVGLRLQDGEAHISTIAVHPDWRGKGLGELLLLTAMEKALELGVSRVTLEVRASNWVAQHLYRKYGLHFKGVRRGYYRDGEDAWLMGVAVDGDAYRARLVELRQALKERLHRQQIVESISVGQNGRDRL
jgi:ribosomal-protein-alanine N-acetyltransferase